MVVEGPGGAVVLDAGVMFPDSELLGVDLVLPDFSYVDRIKGSVRGIFLTHGHEDHIGALPYLIPRLGKTTIYASELTARLAARKLTDAGLAEAVRIKVIADRQTTSIAGMDFTPFATAHSVPDACGVVIETEEGRILHTGDFKIDTTPLDGRRTDLRFVGQMGELGVDVMLCDSTNAVERGWIPSEREVGRFLRELFGSRRHRRVVATCFASHLHRIQQIVDAAVEFGRKVCFVGRSIERNVEIAVSAGKLSLPEGVTISKEELAAVPPERTCLVCTGSQGEPYSSLALMAAGEHPAVKIGATDTILVSSHPIPGNEPALFRVIDRLYARGAEVLYSEVCPDVHVSGHAAAEDVKLMISLAAPKTFVPVHGERRHLVSSAALAREMGVPDERVLLAKNGDTVVLEAGSARLREDNVPGGMWYVDSGAVTEAVPGERAPHEVLRERVQIAREGLLVVVVTVSAQTGALAGDVEIVGKGWRAEYSLDEKGLASLKRRVAEAVEESTTKGVAEWGTLKRLVRSAATEQLRKAGGGRPMIIPVVIEV